MAHINFHSVSNLINICSVDVFSKGSFNARAISKKLLNNARHKNINCNLCCFIANMVVMQMHRMTWAGESLTAHIRNEDSVIQLIENTSADWLKIVFP